MDPDIAASNRERVLRALAPRTDDARLWWVPGRIEFLGKHTDYAGGRSLLCAVERGLTVAAAPRSDGVVRVVDVTWGGVAEGSISASQVVRQEHWSNYPLTVCRRLARNFPGRLRGADIAFTSDLPAAAGLSSSSALIVATYLALADANDLSARTEYREAIHGPEDLAAYLGAIENGAGFRGLAGDRGVGTQGGSEDHTAILCARPDALVQYAFAPLRFERAVPLPDDYREFVVAMSGVVAAKTGSALALYNRASARAAAALDAWREATGSVAPSLAAALAETPDAMDRFRSVLRLQPELLARVEQFAVEARIVSAAADALEGGDLDRLGRLVDESRHAAERLLGNQIPETVALADTARELGALAASPFGAGFGGSVYALVHREGAEEFRRRWAEAYTKAFPASARDATFFITGAGAPASRL